MSLTYEKLQNVYILDNDDTYAFNEFAHKSRSNFIKKKKNGVF